MVLAGVLTAAVGGAFTGLGWVRLREDLILSNALLGLMLGVAGFLVARYRPGNVIGWLLLAGGVGYATSAAGYVVLALATEPGESGFGWRLLATATNVGWPVAVGLSIPLTLLLFPDGRPLGPAWRWLVGLAAVNAVSFIALVGLPAGVLSASVGVEGYPALTGDWLRTAWTWLVIPGLAIYLAGLVALVLRYRRGNEALRQQILWVLLAVIALVTLQIVDALWPGDGWLGILSLGLLPAGITVAILRAQLLDIRIVVSRSLLYLLLTGGIALVYLGLVAGLGWLSRGLNTGAAVVATVIIAVAFNPLRVRLQRLLDRAFYGARHDPVRALAAVGERLTEVTAPRGDGLAGVLQALCEVLRLPWAAIVVDGAELAAYGTRPPDRHGVLISSGGEAVGELVVGLRSGESRIAAADERVLALLAAPIGVAVRASRLAEEVARSRERIIGSREEERRRLRRDLHDGLGPVLTGVALNAETALRLLPTDPDRAAAPAGGAAGPDHRRDRRHPAAGGRSRSAGGAGRARSGGRAAGARGDPVPPGRRDAAGGVGGRRRRPGWSAGRGRGGDLPDRHRGTDQRRPALHGQCGGRLAGRVGGRRAGDDQRRRGEPGGRLEARRRARLHPRTDRRARRGLRDPARPVRRPGVGHAAGEPGPPRAGWLAR